APSSQPKEPAHVKPPLAPWRKRATKSGQKPFANAKPTLATARLVSPISTAGRGPSLDAVMPPGRAPAKAPIAKAATSAPALDFDRPSSEAKCGRSGVSAA